MNKLQECYSVTGKTINYRDTCPIYTPLYIHSTTYINIYINSCNSVTKLKIS